MGGFMGQVGNALAQYGRYRAQRNPLVNAFMAQRQQNQPSSAFDDTVSTGDTNTEPPGYSDELGVVPMAQGAIVTKPTTALIGEKGPEVVVPLTDQPGAKVSPMMLGGMPRTRYRHVTGPNAVRHTAPVRSDLPLRPNVPYR